MFQHSAPQEIFAVALPELRKHPGFRRDVAGVLASIRAAQPRHVYSDLIAGRAVPDDVWDALGDAVVNAFTNHAATLLTLEWNGRSPIGGDGCSQVLALRGVHVCVSTDWDADGPFDSVAAAVWSYESFSLPTNDADLSSTVLSTQALCALVEDLGLEVEDLDGFTIQGEPATRSEDGKVVVGAAAVAAAKAARAAADEDAGDGGCEEQATADVAGVAAVASAGAAAVS